MGFPIVSAEPAADGKGLKLSQRRFFYLQPERNDQLWHVPLMIRAKTDRGASNHKVLMTEREMTIPLAGKLQWALVNEGGHGFYRANYAAPLLEALGEIGDDIHEDLATHTMRAAESTNYQEGRLAGRRRACWLFWL